MGVLNSVDKNLSGGDNRNAFLVLRRREMGFAKRVERIRTSGGFRGSGSFQNFLGKPLSDMDRACKKPRYLDF